MPYENIRPETGIGARRQVVARVERRLVAHNAFIPPPLFKLTARGRDIGILLEIRPSVKLL